MAKKEPAANPPKIRYKKGYNNLTSKAKIVNDERTRKQLEQLAKRMCTKREVAAIMGINERTLWLFFKNHPDAAEAWERGKELGRSDLREMLWTHAKEHPQTAQFLAKQKEWLDYSDGRREQEISVNVSSETSEERIRRIKELQQKVIEGTAVEVTDAESE